MKEQSWTTLEGINPGYLGKNKDAFFADLTSKYGEGNWRNRWQYRNGRVLNYLEVFYEIFVAGYTNHFRQNLPQVQFLTDNFSYTYDKDLVEKEVTFNPTALFEQPGKVNQIHHAALNIAIEQFIGIPFGGVEPLQVREGKPNSDPSTWPAGYKWSPGRIMAIRPDLIPNVNLKSTWHWQQNSIEHAYQASKIIQIRE